MSAPEPSPPHDGPGATDARFALLYRELHELAQSHLRRQGAGFTLGTTTLLHELYLQLAGRSGLEFAGRRQFMGYASRAMRGLVIDYARRRTAAKRGGEFVLLPLEEQQVGATARELGDLDALSAALDGLAALDPALTELVDLHFFCGFSFGEIAALHGVSERTVQRDWQKARLYLHQVLRPFLPDGDVPA